MSLHEQHSRAVTTGQPCTCGCTLNHPPAEGTLGIGVGFGTEWGFHSVVWFPYAAEAEATEFAEENGYITQNGVPL